MPPGSPYVPPVVRLKRMQMGRTTRSAVAALAELCVSESQNGPRSVCSDWFAGVLSGQNCFP
jgi:hypothetical protein